MGNQAGIGGAADARRSVKRHGIPAVDFPDALAEAFGKGARITRLQAGQKVVDAGLLAGGLRELAANLKALAAARGDRLIVAGRFLDAFALWLEVAVRTLSTRVAPGNDRIALWRFRRGIRIRRKVVDGRHAGIVVARTSGGFRGRGLSKGRRHGRSGVRRGAEEALEGIVQRFHATASFSRGGRDCKRKDEGFPGQELRCAMERTRVSSRSEDASQNNPSRERSPGRAKPVKMLTGGKHFLSRGCAKDAGVIE